MRPDAGAAGRRAAAQIPAYRHARLVFGRRRRRVPLLRRAEPRRLLIETVGRLVGATYGLDPAPLRRIVVQYGLDGWLLRRIRFAQGTAVRAT